ncbi:MAG: CvpA family protein [Clostridia bacterium]|nr:CvpA family protein [Clostridia bacterium]
MTNLLLVSGGSAIVDLVALAIIILFAVRGLVKGFAKTFVSVFGTILSFLFAVLLSSAVAGFLESEFSLVTKLAGRVSTSLDKLFGENVMGLTLAEASAGGLRDAGVGGWMVSLILTFKSDGGIPPTTPLRDLISPTFAYYIAIAIAVAGLFILFKILFFLLGELVKKLYAIKLIEKVDKTLGFFAGLISGIVHLEFLILLISFIPIPFVQRLYALIQESVIANFVDNINLFARLLSVISIKDVVGFVKSII